MVRAKLEKYRFEAEFIGSTPRAKAEMAFLLKNYKELLEKRHGKEKAEIIYEETFELSHKTEEEIWENFDCDCVRKLR